MNEHTPRVFRSNVTMLDLTSPASLVDSATPGLDSLRADMDRPLFDDRIDKDFVVTVF